MQEQFNLGVISGDKPLKIEAKITDIDLLKIGIVIFIAFFLSGLLANIISR